MPDLISPYSMLLQFEILAMLKNAKIRNNPKEIRPVIIRNLIILNKSESVPKRDQDGKRAAGPVVEYIKQPISPTAAQNPCEI